MWTTWLARTLAAHDAEEYRERQARRRRRLEGGDAAWRAADAAASRVDLDVVFAAPCLEG